MRGRALLIALMALLSLPPAGAGAADLPGGFEEIALATNLQSPTAVAFAPAGDGRMFIALQAGVVRVRLADGTMRPTPLLDIRGQVNSGGDRGLVGIATDTDFAANGFLYLVYATDNDNDDDENQHTSRLVRYTVSPANEVVASKVLLGGTEYRTSCPLTDGNHATADDSRADCIHAYAVAHSIGTVVSDPRDGTLWLGNGDATGFGFTTGNRDLRMRTYNEENFVGKVMHIDREGNGLPGHAFCAGEADLTKTCTKLHAKGFRNPFRFTLPAATGAPPIVADVGNEHREEINLAVAGGNYGWPCWEGADYQPTTVVGYSGCAKYHDDDPATAPWIAPSFQYEHGGGEAAIQAGPIYTRGSYPAEYRGSLFFGDYAQGFVRRFPAGSGPGGFALTPASILSFSQPNGSVPFMQRAAFTQLTSAPNGDLVVVDFVTIGSSGAYGPGRVVQIRATTGNTRPAAVASVDPEEADVNEPVQFTAVDSADPDGDVLTYAWDFNGDGVTDDTTVDPVWTYATTGVRTVTLTVTDVLGATDTTEVTVLVGVHRPRVQISGPLAERLYDGGERIAFAGAATDVDEGGALPAARLRWEIQLIHGSHIHPVVDVAGVSSGAFTALDDHGYDSHYRLRLIATDATGLTATATVAIRPRPATLRVGSEPAGAPVRFGEATFTGTSEITGAVGMRTTLSAPASFAREGATWQFVRWRDGALAPEREYVVRDGGADLIAEYAQTPVTPAAAAGPVAAVGPGAAQPRNTAPTNAVRPRVRFDGVWRGRTQRVLKGTVTDVVARPTVQVALRREVRGRCTFWSTSRRRFSARRSCTAKLWSTARVTRDGTRWRFSADLRAAVPRRTQLLQARVRVSGRTIATATVRVGAAR